MFTENEKTIFLVIIILIIILLIINKKKIFNTFENEVTSNLNENGFVKNELKPSYWYNYLPSEIRSKCFSCEAESDLLHPSNCIDCETPGGRPVDKLLNRVLTR